MDNMKEKVYIFKVCLKYRKGINRTMELKGASSLHEFAETIIDSYDFDNDHAFSFYQYEMSDFEPIYTSFYDYGWYRMESNERSLKENYIYDIIEPHTQWMFLYDYGAWWEFIVQCLGVKEPEIEVTYPRITNKRGASPPQYDPE